jgi:ATP-dependent Lon protease
VRQTLDNSVHGHGKAKRQLERIIGQWINGEQDGYCLGFEGPPGVGKTSLAKYGLSECLQDENGESRPFAMIQMGGDCNGSTLHGHNYTYVASTWGSIVQILMDKRCMNPIIFIDEVDKISKTEHGREIVGILTHLLDPCQNDCFQDKYFNGIDLDLSKALFILSYNDVDAIDRILLDRIHRIKFENLSLEDKIVIAKKHLLPEIMKKMGVHNIHFSDEVLSFVINYYTLEPGVRKLKECLYEIVGEINLEMLLQETKIVMKEITIQDIKSRYFKDRREIKVKQIHNESQVGIINCLWANNYDFGGILSANACFIPSDKFLGIKMTGLLDEMMRESFEVSMTLALSGTSEETMNELRKKYDGTGQKYGIHLHMGDGSVNKSGTSAGIAVAIMFYSLLNNRKIKNDFAVTGEAADLQGSSGEIGALKVKVFYGIKSGVKNFIYPVENQRDMDEFLEKYRNMPLLEGISFYPVSDFKQALDLILV